MSRLRNQLKSLNQQAMAKAANSTCWRLLAASLIIPRNAYVTLGEIRTVLRTQPAAKNLLGDRDIEWSWVGAQVPDRPGTALDFGNGGSFLGLMAAQKGYTVTAVDLGSVQWPYLHPHLHFVQGDILDLPLPTAHFDLVINCSTVEHVGLVGRYEVAESRPDGDLEAMDHLRNLMATDGIMLLTIPVGQDAVFPPMCRVYGKARLPRLLAGFAVKREVFWVKDDQNRWVICERDAALGFAASAGSWDPMQNTTALGCFVLKKSALQS